MIKRLQTYLKNESKGFLLAIVVAILITFSFLMYLKYLGIPMSRAHNLYNKAVISYENGSLEKAKEYLKESIHFWKTPEAEELLEKVN